MKQWIRWSGLIGFIVISAIIVLGWLFAAGPLIKYSIETFGSKAAKAKVEVDDVSLSFDPFGIAGAGAGLGRAISVGVVCYGLRQHDRNGQGRVSTAIATGVW